jgi:hypothetical protein
MPKGRRGGARERRGKSVCTSVGLAGGVPQYSKKRNVGQSHPPKAERITQRNHREQEQERVVGWEGDRGLQMWM